MKIISSATNAVNSYVFASIFDVDLLRGDEIEELYVLLLLNAAEGVNGGRLQLYFEVEASCRSASPSEIHGSNLFKADVNRRLVDVNESPFERVQVAGRRLVRATDRWRSGMTAKKLIVIDRVWQAMDVELTQ